MLHLEVRFAVELASLSGKFWLVPSNFGSVAEYSSIHMFRVVQHTHTKLVQCQNSTSPSDARMGIVYCIMQCNILARLFIS